MPVSGIADTVPLGEFWDELDAFDWAFEWSDDHAVYEAGRRRLERLRGFAKLSPRHLEMFRGFEAHARARNYLLDVVPEKPPRPAAALSTIPAAPLKGAGSLSQ